MVQPSYDTKGQPYYTYDQVSEITARLAADTTIPYNVDSDCSYKTQLYLGRMMQMGIQPAALGRIFNLIPDLSPEGVQRAYELQQANSSTAVMMQNSEPYKGISFKQRLHLRQKGKVNLVAHRVQKDGATFEFDSERGEIAIRSDINESYVGDVGVRFKFDNHTSATIRVLNPATNSVEPMVIDLAYDSQRPLSMSAWKQHQNYHDSIIVAAPLNQPFKIQAGLLTEPHCRRLRRQLGLDESANRQVMADVIENLTPAQNDKVMIDYFNLKDNSCLKRPLTSNGVRDPDFNRLIADNQLDSWISPYEERLKPLAAYSRWLAETDALYAEKSATRGQFVAALTAHSNPNRSLDTTNRR